MLTTAGFNRRMRKTACPVVWKAHGAQSPWAHPIRPLPRQFEMPPSAPQRPPGGTTSGPAALPAPPHHLPPARPEATPYRPLPRQFEMPPPPHQPPWRDDLRVVRSFSPTSPPPPARPEATPYRPLPRHFQKAAPLSHIALEGRPLPCSRLSEPYSSPSRKPARCALRAIFAGLPRHRTVPRLCRPLVPTNTLTPARQNHPPPKKCSTWNNHPLTHPSHAQIYQCPALSISGCQTFSLPHPPLL
jgi:hypothetical protein